MKYLNAAREQLQSCWLFMFSAPSHTKPQNHSGTQEEYLGQAARAIPKDFRQTDRGGGLASSQSSQAGSSPRESAQSCISSLKGWSKLQIPAHSGDRFGRRQQPLPQPSPVLSGTASPSCSALSAASPGTIAAGSLCRLSLWLGREAGMPLEACWHMALDMSDKHPALQVTCLWQLGKAG